MCMTSAGHNQPLHHDKAAEHAADENDVTAFSRLPGNTPRHHVITSLVANGLG